MNAKNIIAFAGTALLSMTAACASQSQPEPLASLGGTIYNESSSTPAQLDVYLGWTYDNGEGDEIAAEIVKVSGQFPLEFQLDVHAPPPDEALIDLSELEGATENESRVGIAYIVAAGNLDGEEAIEGLVEQNLLLYVESDIAPGSAGAELFGGPVEAGFHLLRFVEPGQEDCPADSEFTCVRPTGGADQSLEMRIIDAGGEFDMPNWT